MTERHTIGNEELAIIVRMCRHNRSWTQETLADLAGITLRTVQRVEKGEPSSTDTRRALAAAFEYEDIDVFNKDHDIPTPEELEEQEEQEKKFARNNVTLPLHVATSGRELASLAARTSASTNDSPDSIPDTTAETAAALFDYLRDFGDISEEYTNVQLLEVHKALQEFLDSLRDAGYSVCYAERNTKIRRKHWKDQTPLAFTIIYYMIAESGKEPPKLIVPREISFR